MGTIFKLLERDNFGGRVMMTSNAQNSDEDSDSGVSSHHDQFEVENISTSNIHTERESENLEDFSKATRKQTLHEPAQLSVIADSEEVEVLFIDKGNMALYPEDI